MLQLEHVNLVVTDLERSLHFYQAAFPHWFIRSKGESEWYGKPRTWVHFGDDHQYIAMSDFGKTEIRDREGDQVGIAHFAYRLNNLDALIERMKKAGYEIAYPGSELSSNRKNIYFEDPDGIEVEFVEYLSDIPAQMNE